MTNKWNRWSNICLACAAIFSVVNGFIEQKRMEAEIRKTVADVLSEQEEEV